MNIGLAVQSVCTEFERLWADGDLLVAPRARLRVLVLVRVCVHAHTGTCARMYFMLSSSLIHLTVRVFCGFLCLWN